MTGVLCSVEVDVVTHLGWDVAEATRLGIEADTKTSFFSFLNVYSGYSRYNKWRSGLPCNPESYNNAFYLNPYTATSRDRGPMVNTHRNIN